MSFKLPGTPSLRARPHELADFAECLTLVYGECSARRIERHLGQLDDNARNEGMDDSDAANEVLATRMLVEIEDRRIAAAGGYPFEIKLKSTTLRNLERVRVPQATIYQFLLLATRLDMQKQRAWAGFDGTVLFESLSPYILRLYLHPTRARAMVFGTAVGGRFADKVDDLCRAVGEGGRYRNTDGIREQANDDKLDVVGWLPFADGRPSQISIFGQCKTGTNWTDELTKLEPGSFTERWMERTYQSPPMKAYFISESHDRAQWEGSTRNAKLLFDRCRIVEMIGNGLLGELWLHQGDRTPWEGLLGQINEWNLAAIEDLRRNGWANSF